MKKRILTALIFIHLATFNQATFAFTLKLVSVDLKEKKAVVLVDNVSRNFHVNEISPDGFKLATYSANRAYFYYKEIFINLPIGQTYDSETDHRFKQSKSR